MRFIGEKLVQGSQNRKKGAWDARDTGIGQRRLQLMKNSSILSLKDFFLVLAFLRKAQQGISSCVGLTLTVINPEVILREFLSPANLTRAQTLCVHKLSKVIMIGENKNFVFAVFKRMLPSFKSFNNSKKLSIMSFMPSFSQYHLSRKVSHWILLIRIRSQLTQNTNYGVAGSICLDPNVALWVKMLED